ncbi:MAG: hypothetical protein WA902_06340 [Thermosynechococcaceae cyanobacterium]
MNSHQEKYDFYELQNSLKEIQGYADTYLEAVLNKKRNRNTLMRFSEIYIWLNHFFSGIFYVTLLRSRYEVIEGNNNSFLIIVPAIIALLFASIFPKLRLSAFGRITLAIYIIIIVPSLIVVPIYLSQEILSYDEAIGLAYLFVLMINFFSFIYSIMFSATGSLIPVSLIASSSRLIGRRNTREISSEILFSYDEAVFETLRDLHPIFENKSEVEIETILYYIDKKIGSINLQSQLVAPVMGALGLLSLIPVIVPYSSFFALIKRIEGYLIFSSGPEQGVALFLIISFSLIFLILWFVRYFIHAYWSTRVLEIVSVLCFLKLQEIRSKNRKLKLFRLLRKR